MELLDAFDPRSFVAPEAPPEWQVPPGCITLVERPPAIVAVEAGPGFGKTVLLADLYRRALTRRASAVWVDLGRTPMTGAEFVRRILLGFARGPLGGRSAALALAVTEPAVTPAVLLQVLLAEIEAQPSPCALFLDDLEAGAVADDPFPVPAVIEALTRRPSACLQIRVATREGVANRLGQSSTDVRVVESAELRLDRAGVGVLLRSLLRAGSAPERWDRIYDEVHGWPAGIILAAEVMRRRHKTRITDAFLNDWQLALNDYFDSRVMPAMTPADRDYLRHGSQFRVFTDELVAAISAGGGAASSSHLRVMGKGALVEIIAAGPQPTQRSISRQRPLTWTPAFRDYLQRTFDGAITADERRRAQREAIPTLSALGYHADAVEGLLALGDAEAAANLLEKHAEDILQRTDAGRIRGWREHFGGFAPGSLGLAVFAWSELLSNDIHEAESLIRSARAQANGLGPSRLLSAHLHVLELGVAALSDDLPQVERMIERWPHEFIGHGSAWLEHHMSNARSYVVMQTGHQLNEAASSKRTWTRSDEADLPMLLRHCYLAKISLLSGRFQAAREQIRQGEELAERLPDRLAGARFLPATVLGLLAWEQSDLNLIETQLRPRLPEILDSTLINHRHDAVTALSRTLCARGDFHGALTLLEEARTGPGARLPQRFELELERERLRILCFQQELGQAADVLASMQAQARSAQPYSADSNDGVARILLSSEALVAYAHGDYPRAHTRLLHLIDLLEARGAVGRYPIAQASGLIIATLWQLGRHHDALKHVDRLLRMARASGLRQSLLDWREVTEAPLAAYVESNNSRARPVAEYAMNLLRRVEPPEQPFTSDPAEAGVLDRLSQRERQVLSLAASGLSTKAIARQLAISPNTVKWHLKNSYEKTGVRNRAQASRLFAPV